MSKFCSKCGAKQEDSDSKFCIECGALLKEDVKENAVETKNSSNVVSSTPNVVNSVILILLYVHSVKNRFLLTSRCPFCNNVINANANKHIGALIAGYLLSVLTLFSTLMGLRWIGLTSFLHL